ncbi:MAG: hypothetical protein ACUVX8_16590 [Candidatus Zipacnadales bacterium]
MADVRALPSGDLPGPLGSLSAGTADSPGDAPLVGWLGEEVICKIT